MRVRGRAQFANDFGFDLASALTDVMPIAWPTSSSVCGSPSSIPKRICFHAPKAKRDLNSLSEWMLVEVVSL